MRELSRVEEAYKLFGFRPNVMQRKFWELCRNFTSNCLILRAPTGSGKTEATFFPFFIMDHKVVYVLPTRSLIDDHEVRFKRYLKKVSELSGDLVTMAIDKGDEICWSVFYKGMCEEKDQHLYNADVILTTFDKFVYRIYGYGSSKSFFYPFRVFHKREPIAIIFDEAHMYIPMRVALTNLLYILAELITFDNITPIISSATMPYWFIDEIRERLNKKEVKVCDFMKFLKFIELLSDLKKSGLFGSADSIKFLYDPDVMPRKQSAISLVDLVTRYYNEEKSLIAKIHDLELVNEVFELLLNRIKELYLYHGHMPYLSRKVVYKALKQLSDKSKSYLLVTTHAIEVGCDLDSDILVLELCPPENFLQSIGRLNRRFKKEGAMLVVVGKEFSHVHRRPLEEAGAYPFVKKEIIDVVESFNEGTISLAKLVHRLSRIIENEAYKSAVFPGLDKNIEIKCKDYFRLVELEANQDLDRLLSMWEEAEIITRNYEQSVKMAVKESEKETETSIGLEEVTWKNQLDDVEVKIEEFVPEMDRYLEVKRPVRKRSIRRYRVTILIPQSKKQNFIKEVISPNRERYYYYVKTPKALREIKFNLVE
ncbi:MAG: CRISPR-associated helicase Cas3', partial [Nitrososphaeria archaeon]